MTEVLPDKSFGERVKEVIRLVGSAEKLARLTGVSARGIGHYAAGTSDPTRTKIVTLSEAAGVNVLWLATGEGPKMKVEVSNKLALKDVAFFEDRTAPEEYVKVPRYDVSASAGPGVINTSEQVVDYLQFKPDWIKNVLGVSAQNLALISVKGDSMVPTLSDGDVLLVDTTDRHFQTNAIYVLQLEGSLLVKRIQRKIDGTVVIKSDNKAYEPETVRGDIADQLHVVGRVAWYGRRG
ncbi:MAG: helix-turn-helix transcriptional regulator [Geobacter sp.]|nr:MAG: helix-turn-helix transcriptional regulator [Geobacter sp.]